MLFGIVAMIHTEHEGSNLIVKRLQVEGRFVVCLYGYNEERRKMKNQMMMRMMIGMQLVKLGTHHAGRESEKDVK